MASSISFWNRANAAPACPCAVTACFLCTRELDTLLQQSCVHSNCRSRKTLRSPQLLSERRKSTRCSLAILLQISLQFRVLPAQSFQSRRELLLYLISITSSAVAIQMGREPSASHVSRQPHKSRVLPAYSSNARPPTRSSPASLTAQSPLRFAPVRSLTAFHHCAVPTALRPTTQFQLRRHLRRSTALRYHEK